MKRAFIAAGLAVAALALAGGSGAISNGVPDGNNHPNVGLFAIGFEDGGQLIRFAGCSGSYGGPRVGHPEQKVFVTAAHCVNGIEASGLSPGQVWVTFDSTVDIDIETGAITSSNTWYQASGIAFDSGTNPANAQDYAVILLTGAPAGLAPIQFPTAGLLAQLAAKGGLKPGALMDSVGYGVVPTFTKGRPQYDVPPGRMFATSIFKGLTQSLVKLNANENKTPENGGACFGDSGSPKFLHGTNTAVAIQFGGDAICRSLNYASRLDIPAARAFYGQYLALP